MREITYAEAIMEAFREEMRRDDRVFHICGNLGPLAGLVSEFGIERLRASPISEEAYVGAGIGAAGSGFRPIISPGMMTFAFTAMDQIVNQMAKIHYMFGGQAPFPAGFPRLNRRRAVGGGAALAESAPHVHELGRAEAGHALQPLRCQGPDEERHPRQQPGGVL